MIDDKKSSLHAAVSKEQSLRAECDRIGIENHKLMMAQSESMAMHLEITKRLNNDLQSMIANQDDLEDQLRENKLQRRLEKEELLNIANQRSISLQREE